MAMTSLVLGLGVLSLKPGFIDFNLAEQILVGDLRVARMQATLRGVHFRVTVSQSSYEVVRLEDVIGDGSWEPDGAFEPKHVDLPADVSLYSDGDPAGIEFNSRGMAEPPASGSFSVVTLTLSDGKSGAMVQVEVWPSGQIQPVDGSGGGS